MVLCLVMVCSMSVNAFAAEIPDSKSYWGEEKNTENVIGNIDSRAAILLDPSETLFFRLGTLEANQTVTFTVQWEPSQIALNVGFTNSLSSYSLRSVTGGAATFTMTTTSAGLYYVVLKNPSSSTTVTVGSLTYLI